ncbi:hypothetical protein B7494_g4586 [Chlorociboria aeruginascens]|nr:hypothetical protein B7494_g4586 [Chlorociboria aeruginascens]
MATTTPAATSTADQPKIKLYWLDQSRSQRILWLLEELSLPYELSIFHRDPKTRLAPPELKEIHALGKSPVISITPSSGKPVIIAESAFIIEYLLDHFGGESTLLPRRYREGEEGRVGGETEQWLRFRYFMHYTEGSLMSLMLMTIVVLHPKLTRTPGKEIKNSPVPFFIKPITSSIASKINTAFLDPNFATHFSFLESQLSTSPEEGKYLCGPNLTAADILLSFPLMAAKSRTGLTKEKYPLLWGYTERLEGENGYKKAMEKIVAIEGKFEATFKL